MSTVSISEVREAFESVKRAWDYAGITRAVNDYDHKSGETETITFTASDLQLQEGSVTYGRAFRLFYVHPTTGGHYMTEVPDYLGSNRREALLTLRALSSGIWAANRSA